MDEEMNQNREGKDRYSKMQRQKEMVSLVQIPNMIKGLNTRQIADHFEDVNFRADDYLQYISGFKDGTQTSELRLVCLIAIRKLMLDNEHQRIEELLNLNVIPDLVMAVHTNIP